MSIKSKAYYILLRLSGIKRFYSLPYEQFLDKVAKINTKEAYHAEVPWKDIEKIKQHISTDVMIDYTILLLHSPQRCVTFCNSGW